MPVERVIDFQSRWVEITVKVSSLPGEQKVLIEFGVHPDALKLTPQQAQELVDDLEAALGELSRAADGSVI